MYEASDRGGDWRRCEVRFTLHGRALVLKCAHCPFTVVYLIWLFSTGEVSSWLGLHSTPYVTADHSCSTGIQYTGRQELLTLVMIAEKMII